MRYAVFLIDLNQDVAACQAVARFFRRESPFAIAFVVTTEFRKRDITDIWSRELELIAQELDAQLVDVEAIADAVHFLAGKGGVLVAASESALKAHAFSHSVFLAAPSGFIRLTLQHGLECIGFNHNDSHDRTWQHYIGMACDIAGSWFEIDALHSVRPDQRAKIMTLGPPIGLEDRPSVNGQGSRRAVEPAIHGLVCENLHAVRYGDQARTDFLDIFASFAQRLAERDGTLELRPHPGGLYSEKNAVSLPHNVRFNRLPLHRQSLSKFSFCISGPSTVLFDLIWANVPVAVWARAGGRAELGMYSSIRAVSTESEWMEFALAATRDPRPFLQEQAQFLATLRIPPDIQARYRALLRAVTR